MTDTTAPRAGLMQSAWANPILLLVLTTLIWAGHSIVGRLAVGQIGPMTLTTLRWALALIPILIVARPALRRDWRPSCAPTGCTWPRWAHSATPRSTRYFTWPP